MGDNISLTSSNPAEVEHDKNKWRRARRKEIYSGNSKEQAPLGRRHKRAECDDV